MSCKKAKIKVKRVIKSLTYNKTNGEYIVYYKNGNIAGKSYLINGDHNGKIINYDIS